MKKAISKNEKTDLLLVLALAFERKFSESALNDADEKILPLAETFFRAAADADFADLRARALFLDELPEESRRLWQEIQLDKLRRRGQTLRLDENIDSSQIAAHLNREPKTVQNLILKNLPDDLRRQVESCLQNGEISSEKTTPTAALSENRIPEEIAALVKRKFLANFTALEDIYEPNTTDKFTAAELENFIRQLGVHEIAAACRGINSKELLAAFLNRFDEIDAREIALYITELEEIRPFWVLQAGELLRQTWDEKKAPAKLLELIGMKLLAFVFATRGEAAKQFTAQKLAPEKARIWREIVDESERKTTNADENTRAIFEKRKDFVSQLALNFAQTGKL